MSIASEFREFAVKGNVVDMAVGIIVGGAFGKIANSLVADIIMPPIGVLLGKVNFTDLKWVIQSGVPAVEAADGVEAVAAVPEVAINYGTFIQATLDFLIVSIAVFLLVKGINAMRRKDEEEKAEEGEEGEDGEEEGKEDKGEDEDKGAKEKKAVKEEKGKD